MSDPSSFESRLADVLERYGERAPVEVDAAALVQALTAARGHRGHGHWRSPRALRFAIAFALLVTLAAVSLLAAGSLRSTDADDPRPGRLLIWAEGWAWILGPAESEQASGSAAIRTTSPCPVLIPGSDTLALEWSHGIVSFTAFDQTAVPGDIQKPSLAFTAWPPDHAHLAVVDQAGALEIYSFAEPARPAQQRFDVPGIVGATWAPDGRRIAMARRMGDGAAVEIDVIDVVSGRRSAGPRIDTASLLEEAYVPMSWAPSGDRVLIALPRYDEGREPYIVPSWDLVFVDVAGGRATLLVAGFSNINPWYGWHSWDGSSGGGYNLEGTWQAAAWAPDGSRIAIEGGDVEGETLTVIEIEGGRAVAWPISHPLYGDLAWSGDGSRLAWLEDSDLVTISPDGMGRSTHAIPTASGRGYGRPALVPGSDGDSFLVAHGSSDARIPSATGRRNERASGRRADHDAGVLVENYPARGDAPPTRVALLEYPGEPSRTGHQVCLGQGT